LGLRPASIGGDGHGASGVPSAGGGFLSFLKGAGRLIYAVIGVVTGHPGPIIHVLADVGREYVANEVRSLFVEVIFGPEEVVPRGRGRDASNRAGRGRDGRGPDGRTGR
jgi:hypothetical protein